jgi:putative addiction module component (TIGR02574 family)
MNADLLEAAKALPLPERIELAEALWESITGEGHEPPLTPAQADELDRRLEEHRRDPKSGIPWEQVKVELDQKYRRSSKPARSFPVEDRDDRQANAIRELARWFRCEINTRDFALHSLPKVSISLRPLRSECWRAGVQRRAERRV